jgi:malonyl CoA-acyl carrier protein transacylase/phosphopantetheinyl transferase
MIGSNFIKSFETELVLVGGASRGDIMANVRKALAHTVTTPGATLADIALTLDKTRVNGAPCLAIVAATVDELSKKLAHALQKLEKPETVRIQDKSGIFYYEEPLSEQGQLAFVIPGEGAQYTNMLLDLCLHFPEARDAFDSVDRAIARAHDGFVPSSLIFPVPGSVPEGADVEALWGMEGAVEAVVSADTALMRIFVGGLKIHPDAVVGHSSGEFFALEAAGVVRFEDDVSRERDYILAGYHLMKELNAAQNIPEGILLTVGGPERSVIDQVLAKYPGRLVVAMDNCPHQYVLCGPREVINEVNAQLSAEGAICNPLAFSRPYHTDWFRPALDGLRKFFQKVKLHPPQIPIYSCLSANKFPNDLAEIERLAVDQWAGTVRFKDTIEKMYDDGVRIFVEVGPRGNLSAFVDDILKGKPHLAVASNRPHRSGITQLHHALGMLAAHGVKMDLAYLHKRRGSRVLQATQAAKATKGTTRPLQTASPMLSAAKIEPKVGRGIPTAPNPVVVQVAAAPAAPAVDRQVAEQVMLSYIETMDQFLDSQKQIIDSFLGVGTLPVEEAPALPAAVVEEPVVAAEPERPVGSEGPIGGNRKNPFPMLGDVIEHVPGEKMVSIRMYSLADDVFLQDHTLATQISVVDSERRGFSIMPLTMSLEIMAEAGAALVAGKRVVGMKDVQANRWIAFEDGENTVRITATRISKSPDEVRVAIREERAGDPRNAFRPPLCEATILLGDDYPAPKKGEPLVLEKPEKPSGWKGFAIYPERLFHLPRFQAIKSIDRWAEDGMEGQLQVLERDHLFRDNPAPTFTIDGIFLDALGASLGLWDAYDIYNGIVFLPMRVKRIDFYGPPLKPGAKLTLRVKILDENDITCKAHIYAVDENGNVYMDLTDWEDRIFQLTPGLHRIFLRSTVMDMSDTWKLPAKAPAPLKKCSFNILTDMTDELLESSHRVWQKMLAFLALSEEELVEWRNFKGVEQRRIQWLCGRAVAKEAARHFLKKNHKLELGSPDFSIATDDNGKPLVRGKHVTAPVEISLSHTDGATVAVAGDPADGRLGIDIEKIRQLNPDFMDGAFSAADMPKLFEASGGRNVDEWALRVWCAKEALTKAAGIGMRYDARDIHVNNIKASTGEIELSFAGSWVADVPAFAGRRIQVMTARHGEYVLACVSG